MTQRSLFWINDQGVLVGRTTIGEFAVPPLLGALSLPVATLTRGLPASGAILGSADGSTISGAGLPPGFTINPGPSWAYDGSAVSGVFTLLLAETLAGSPNSPNTTTIALVIVTAGGAVDFSQPAMSGLIAAVRSF